MKIIAAAPIWLFVYATPGVPLGAGWFDSRRIGGSKLAKVRLIVLTISLLWLYSGCFTQVLIGPSYGTIRGVLLIGNFFAVVVIGVSAWFAPKGLRLWVAIAAFMTAFFWLITIAANAVA